MGREATAEFPAKLQFLFSPKRYKVLKGGRGGAKSWGIARALLLIGSKEPKRILCTREFQKSIADSVHKLLSDQIKKLELTHFYSVTKTGITGRNGTEFIFTGLKHNIDNVKSFEAVDIVWVEEAHNVSKASWEVLIPTIRKDGSEIWVSYNPDLETDDTHQRFAIKTPPDAAVVTVNWRDNPWFNEVLRKEMEHLKATDVDSYQHVYEGVCKQVVEGAIYREQLIAAEKEERICNVPYDAAHPVHTFWDLGFGDNVSVWFAQSIGFEFRLIDFMQNCLKDLSFYLKEIQERPYIYGTHYLPHDAKAQTLAAGGRSIEQQVKSGGRKVEIVHKLDVEDGISAARLIFSRCYFDKVKCADGLQALRHYRYEKDEDLNTYKKAPLHDWSSHAADAFRYFAVAIREPARKKEAAKAASMPTGAHGWMR